MRTSLTLLCGSELGRSVHDITERIMTNSVQCSCNWEGRIGWKGKQKPKYALGKTKLATVMIDAILDSQLHVTASQATQALMVYARNAPGRGGNKKKTFEGSAATPPSTSSAEH